MTDLWNLNEKNTAPYGIDDDNGSICRKTIRIQIVPDITRYNLQSSTSKS